MGVALRRRWLTAIDFGSNNLNPAKVQLFQAHPYHVGGTEPSLVQRNDPWRLGVPTGRWWSRIRWLWATGAGRWTRRRIEVDEGIGKGQISVPRSNGAMPEASAPVSRKSPRTANGRKTREVNRAVVLDIDRMRRDAGMSVRRLAQEASIDAGYLSQLLGGLRSPSTAVLVALTAVLGADLSIRVYPTTGPTVRDAIQARIGEELLRIAACTWKRSIEVPVYRPARGFIDIVFDEPVQSVAVATEIQSRIDRLEQQIRWAQDKGAIPAVLGYVAVHQPGALDQPDARTSVPSGDPRDRSALRIDPCSSLPGAHG
jgi:transcriptional regulator with XRE-family HTH domain